MKNKIKLHKVINLFSGKENIGPGIKVYGTITSFARKVELMEVMEQINNIIKMYEDDRQECIKKLLQDYCKDTEQKPEDFTKLPNEKIPELEQWMNNRLNSEIEIKNFKFKPEEIKESNINGFEMMALKDFYDINALKKYNEKTKD